MQRGVRWDATLAEEKALARALLQRVHVRVSIAHVPIEKISPEYADSLEEAFEGWTTLEVSLERQGSTEDLWLDMPRFALDLQGDEALEIEPVIIATALGETWPTTVPPPPGPPPIYVGTTRTGLGCGANGRVRGLGVFFLRLLGCYTLGDRRKHYVPHPDQKDTRSYFDRLDDARREEAPRTLEVLAGLHHRHNSWNDDDGRHWSTWVVTYETEQLRRARATIDLHVQARGRGSRRMSAVAEIPGARLAEGSAVSGPLMSFDTDVSARLRRDKPAEPPGFR